MELGFSSIIADGIQKSQEANERSFEALGTGLGGIARGIRQNRYAKGHKDLFSEKLALELKRDKGEELTPEETGRLDNFENIVRDYNIEHYNRGARTELTPQDYEKRDAAEMAAKQSMLEGLYGAHDRYLSQARMYSNAGGTILANGATSEEALNYSKKLEELGEENMGYADEVAEYAIGLGGVPMRLLGSKAYGKKTDGQENGGAGSELPFATDKEMSSLAGIFLRFCDGTPTVDKLAEFMQDKEFESFYKLSSTQKAEVVKMAKERFAADKEDKEYTYEQRIKKQRDADDKKLRDLELKAAERAKAKGNIELGIAEAIDESQNEFLSNPKNLKYSPSNAIRVGVLFKDFKSDEKINGKTVAGLAMDLLNKKANEEATKTEYETFVKALSKKVNPTAKNDGLSKLKGGR